MGKSFIEITDFADLIGGYVENGGLCDHDMIWECLEALGRKPAVDCLYEDLKTRALDYPETLIEKCGLSEVFPHNVELMDALYLNRYMTRLHESLANTESSVNLLDAGAEGIMGFFYRFWNNRINSEVAAEFYMIRYDALIDLLKEFYGERRETRWLLYEVPKVKEFYDAKLNMWKVFQKIDASVPRIWCPWTPLENFANQTRAAILDMENCILKPLFYAFRLIELDGDICGHEISETEIILPSVGNEGTCSPGFEEDDEDEEDDDEELEKAREFLDSIRGKGGDRKWLFLKHE